MQSQDCIAQFQNQSQDRVNLVRNLEIPRLCRTNTHTLTIFLLVSRSNASGLEMMEALTYQSGASGEWYLSSTSRGESLSNGEKAKKEIEKGGEGGKRGEGKRGRRKRGGGREEEEGEEREGRKPSKEGGNRKGKEKYKCIKISTLHS